MLKGIPNVLSPELLKILAEMGHGDTITIGDANFAAASMAAGGRLVRADGISSARMTDAILQLMPLDAWTASAVTVMGAPVPGKKDKLQIMAPTQTLLDTVAHYDPQAAGKVTVLGRFEFYEQAKKSYAVLAAGDGSLYGCIILQKGTIESA